MSIAIIIPNNAHAPDPTNRSMRPQRGRSTDQNHLADTALPDRTDIVRRERHAMGVA